MKMARAARPAPLVLVALIATFLPACAATPRGAAPDAALVSASGPTSLAVLTEDKPVTVLVFVAPHCPVQRAHGERLAALTAQFPTVGFLGVASEVDVALDEVAREAPFPVVRDPDGALARALGVEFATHAVVLGAPRAVSAAERRVVRYSGGLDGDAARLSPASPPYLADALADVLAGRPVRTATSEPMGCPLRLR